MRIFLIGFMGCGKSHWAKIWGEKFGIPVVDLDKKIEAKEGCTINEVFKNFGEEYFRNLERESLLETKKNTNCIVACGGGTPVYLNNLNWMKQNGKVVYLEAKPEELFKNILKETKSRPLLQGLKGKELINLITLKLNERKPFYESSDLILNSTELNLESFQKIIDYA